VKFDANGGTGTMESVSCKLGTNYYLPECSFTPPAGMRFKSWLYGSTVAYPIKNYVGSTGPSTITIVADWEPIPNYQATFVADGVTVDTVTFREGDSSLPEPAVPSKAHYDGAWEDYDLASATGDITINAVYTQNKDHSGNETAVVTAPTCTETGYTTYTCSLCGDKRQGDETAALGHDYKLDVAQSAPSIPGKEGFDYYVCSRDPSHFKKVPVPAPIMTHKATFMIGEEIIGEVVFDEGASALEEPAMPERPNYVGQWDAYDLAAAKADITIQGHYTPVDPDKISEAEGKAEAEYANGVVNITLTAQAASRTIKVISKKTKPVDVVLVLDQSGSMAEKLSARDRRSKRDALVNCANEFIQELYQNAVDTGVNHKAAVVGFAYSSYNEGKCVNTGLLATPSGRFINYNSITNNDYASALLPINDGGSINPRLVSGIDSIKSEGATAADLGLKIARNIFAETPTTEEERERIVVFITDGVPTWWDENAKLVRLTATEAISEANIIKNGQGAKIYSVGVHADADPAAAFTAAKDGVTTDRRGNFESYDFNRFLHVISSNYPEAKAMDNLGQGDQKSGFYMGVRDTSNLESIFTNILYSTVYQIKTFDKATLRYTLSNEFTLTMEQELKMREELKASLGMTDSDIQVSRNEDGTTTLCFQNVKAQETYDESKIQCYKASVHFQVSANRLAVGSVTTGTSDSGVEYGDSTIVPLEPPTVTIPQNRNLIVFTINGQAYRIQEANLGDAIIVPETELASWKVAEGTKVTGDYAVFEAKPNMASQYAIYWIIDGDKVVAWYPVGAAVVPPEVPAKAGYDFTGWDRKIPSTMPAYDLVCTAIYSPAHVHSYEKSYQSGSCDKGIVTTYRCACGEMRTETASPASHNFIAVLSDNGIRGNTVERVVCTRCGLSEEQNISFRVSSSKRGETTVLDLSLFQNEVNVIVPKEEIEMRFYVGEDGGKTYTVTRIDSDGHRTSYKTKAENGYLIFLANHFSIYVISELGEDGQTPTEEVTYDDAVEILDSKEEVVLPPDRKPEGGTGNSTGGTPSGSSSSGSSARDPSVAIGGDGKGGKVELGKDGSLTITPDEGYKISKITINGKEVKIPEDGNLTGLRQTDKVVVIFEETPTFIPVSERFTDVIAGSWYENAVQFAVDKGLFKGMTETAFAPNKTMSRGMLATVLYRLAEQPDADPSDLFNDVADNKYYAPAIAWAASKDVVSGYGNGKFGPNDNITREQLVAMVWRYEGKPAASNLALNFKDASQTSDWALEAMHWAVENGIINGYSDGRLDPQGQATRAQVAQMLMGYCKLAE